MSGTDQQLGKSRLRRGLTSLPPVRISSRLLLTEQPADPRPHCSAVLVAPAASTRSRIPDHQRMKDSTIRICLWSGPRNISTALLYSFAQRRDTEPVDEPLYAHFLRVSGARHPLRDACLKAQDTDGERVVRNRILGPCSAPVVFFKQMAHHLVDLNLGFLRQTTNLFLTRDPKEMLPSLQQQIGTPTLRDTGLARQCEVVALLEEWGQTPTVLDSKDLLRNPAAGLKALCERIELPYDDAMLRWPAGPKEFDGVWARQWYRNVHRSTGFQPYRPKRDPFPDELSQLLEQCMPFYAELRGRTLRF